MSHLTTKALAIACLVAAATVSSASTFNSGERGEPRVRPMPCELFDLPHCGKPRLPRDDCFPPYIKQWPRPGLDDCVKPWRPGADKPWKLAF